MRRIPVHPDRMEHRGICSLMDSFEQISCQRTSKEQPGHQTKPKTYYFYLVKYFSGPHWGTALRAAPKCPDCQGFDYFTGRFGNCRPTASTSLTGSIAYVLGKEIVHYEQKTPLPEGRQRGFSSLFFFSKRQPSCAS